MLFQARFPIHAVSKGRPRFTRNGHCFTPTATRQFETELVHLARALWGKPPLVGALAAQMIFYLTPPKICKRAYPAVRPDTDNYAKAVLDALNGVLWEDDSQIVDLSVSKRYGQAGISLCISLPWSPGA